MILAVEHRTFALCNKDLHEFFDFVGIVIYENRNKLTPIKFDDGTGTGTAVPLSEFQEPEPESTF